ncbi:unnamed protein product [Rangifer tarandus platyrhynchus]|uniref:Uncharacterized protein n=1 Tax=Rangifer tarandus platyrhynchus TaxID=3082113 RepID=A0ABN8XIS2_RANTA|nr:unnamed protein product [Rangifer tarandus platyrhynchus]
MCVGYMSAQDGKAKGLQHRRNAHAAPLELRGLPALIAETAVAYDVYLVLKYLNYKAVKLGSLFSKGHDLFYTFGYSSPHITQQLKESDPWQEAICPGMVLGAASKLCTRKHPRQLHLANALMEQKEKWLISDFTCTF